MRDSSPVPDAPDSGMDAFGPAGRLAGRFFRRAENVMRKINRLYLLAALAGPLCALVLREVWG